MGARLPNRHCPACTASHNGLVDVCARCLKRITAICANSKDTFDGAIKCAITTGRARERKALGQHLARSLHGPRQDPGVDLRPLRRQIKALKAKLARRELGVGPRTRNGFKIPGVKKLMNEKDCFNKSERASLKPPRFKTIKSAQTEDTR